MLHILLEQIHLAGSSSIVVHGIQTLFDTINGWLHEYTLAQFSYSLS